MTNCFEIMSLMSDSYYWALFIRKTENGSLGWLISFNIQTTTKIIIFFYIFQFPARYSQQSTLRKHGENIKVSRFPKQALFFTLLYNQLYFILKSTKFFILDKNAMPWRPKISSDMIPMPLSFCDTASIEF